MHYNGLILTSIMRFCTCDIQFKELPIQENGKRQKFMLALPKANRQSERCLCPVFLYQLFLLCQNKISLMLIYVPTHDWRSTQPYPCHALLYTPASSYGSLHPIRQKVHPTKRFLSVPQKLLPLPPCAAYHR